MNKYPNKPSNLKNSDLKIKDIVCFVYDYGNSKVYNKLLGKKAIVKNIFDDIVYVDWIDLKKDDFVFCKDFIFNSGFFIYRFVKISNNTEKFCKKLNKYL